MYVVKDLLATIDIQKEEIQHLESELQKARQDLRCNELLEKMAAAAKHQQTELAGQLDEARAQAKDQATAIKSLSADVARLTEALREREGG